MEIAFSTRSRFLADFQTAIAAGRDQLQNSKVFTIHCEEGGYPGQVIVTIRADNSATFGTDWEGSDETRFPARIKAAATAMQSCGVFGQFLVCHRDRSLEISPLQ